MASNSIELDDISDAIILLRGQRVILDRDLAALYGVSTARLNEAVKRNLSRFPVDFAFRLTRDEHDSLMSQFAISKTRGGHRKLPRVFTEHGAIQAANVLNSERAAEVGVHVVRAFVRLRELLSTNSSLAQQLLELERKYERHDKSIADMLAALRQLLHSPTPKKRGIGFTADVG